MGSWGFSGVKNNGNDGKYGNDGRDDKVKPTCNLMAQDRISVTTPIFRRSNVAFTGLFC